MCLQGLIHKIDTSFADCVPCGRRLVLLFLMYLINIMTAEDLAHSVAMSSASISEYLGLNQKHYSHISAIYIYIYICVCVLFRILLQVFKIGDFKQNNANRLVPGSYLIVIDIFCNTLFSVFIFSGDLQYKIALNISRYLLSKELRNDPLIGLPYVVSFVSS